MRTHRDTVPAFIMSFPANLGLRRVPLAVKRVPRVWVLLQCHLVSHELGTRVEILTATNAFSCSSGFGFADIALVCSFCDAGFTLQRSLLTADIRWPYLVFGQAGGMCKPSSGVELSCAPVN